MREYKMYVWEVRAFEQYDGVYWRVLIRDDNQALEKIKETLLKDLRDSHDYDLLAKSQISIVEGLTKLADYLEFEKRHEALEVEKIEVN